jgi:hypothetical protein
MAYSMQQFAVEWDDSTWLSESPMMAYTPRKMKTVAWSPSLALAVEPLAAAAAAGGAAAAAALRSLAPKLGERVAIEARARHRTAAVVGRNDASLEDLSS